jgi:hypothetical protein
MCNYFIFFQLIIRIDETVTSEYVPFEFDLFGSGRLYFGSSSNREANSFHGLLKDVKIKFYLSLYDEKCGIIIIYILDLYKVLKC